MAASQLAIAVALSPRDDQVYSIVRAAAPLADCTMLVWWISRQEVEGNTEEYLSTDLE